MTRGNDAIAGTITSMGNLQQGGQETGEAKTTDRKDAGIVKTVLFFSLAGLMIAVLFVSLALGESLDAAFFRSMDFVLVLGVIL
jgi:hypothetical protein